MEARIDFLSANFWLFWQMEKCNGFMFAFLFIHILAMEKCFFFYLLFLSALYGYSGNGKTI
jgi:hypothetical protein